MAQVEPLRALRYDPAVTGGLQPVVAPPYDVIDAEQLAALRARSPYNIVHLDLPEGGEHRYEQAGELLERWRERSVIVRDDEPALWTLVQRYTGPDGRERTRHGFLARVRVVPYGPGRVLPHERTHAGPREDRLRLTRATRANVSPILALYSDPAGAAQERLEGAAEAWSQTTGDDGTVNRLGRVVDPAAIRQATDALAGAELLIADGHHRYETALAYAEEVGGEGPHRYVLACLVAAEDPGLTVFPTHRLVSGLTESQRDALAETLRRDFRAAELDGAASPVPQAGDGVRIGYADARLERPLMLELSDPALADRALAGHSRAYRRLDTAVLEALVLRGALGLGDEQIDRLDGLRYSRDPRGALELVRSGRCDAAFFMAPIPIERVREVAAAGETMPPKSTYFYPKVPNGLVLNSLE